MKPSCSKSFPRGRPGCFRRHASRRIPTLWVAGLLVSTLVPGFGAPLVIDDFAYPSTTTARWAWSAISAPPVSMATSGDWGDETVMLLPCDFATREGRCYWDRSVALNLAAYTDFALELFAPDPGAISHFTLYFRSGAGWYGRPVSISQTGWQRLRFTKSEFIPEGTPAGWDKVDGIRLSPWKGASRNTDLALRQLQAYTPEVLLLRDDLSSNPTIVEQTIDRHRDWLGRYGLECGVVSRVEVEAGLLAQARLVVLPYNENISTNEWTALENFVAGGGKLLVYYLLPSRMEPLLGVRRTGWAQGDYTTWVFSDPAIPALPSRVQQASWNITFAVPNGTLNSRVIATWEDSRGVSTGRAAWLRSDHGYFVSHVLLGDDAGNKSYALLCLLGYFLPDAWPTAATGAIDALGWLGPYQNYPEAEAGIREAAQTTLRAPLAEAELSAAAADRSRALSAVAATNYAEAVQAAHAAQAHLKQAYYLSLRPVTPEFRAMWEHHATGPYPGNWAAAIDALATNGFTAVFPNMLWGGLAHYNSSVLPRSADYTNHGDQIQACVNAAHARGIEVHVWKVNWRLSGAPQSYIDALRAAGRTQVSSSGQPMDWLCPSHPDNFALETNSMLEVVRNYAVDGIHFDYIRYPDGDHCYCAGCAARFQSQTGQTITNWPAAVLASGPLRTAFLDWRRAQITRLVAAVYAGVKALKPAVRVSAAVFPDAASAYDGVGQDWRLWITNGILDFVCPMDYTTSLSQFTNLMAQQLGFASGRLPLYPGIGAYVLEPDAFLAQLQATRAARTRGFIAFELSPGAVKTLLPPVRAGATAPDEPDTDEDLLPDSWEARWFGSLAVAAANSDSDGDGVTDYDEYVAGTDPTQPNPRLNLQARWTGSAVEISFPAQAAEGAGYQNAARHYRLETRAGLEPHAVWTAVAGFEDHPAISGSEVVTYSVTPASTAPAFFRTRVWLQQQP